MSGSGGQDVLTSDTSFAPGTWGSGGFDGIGFYTGGAAGTGTATLSGTITAMGDPVTADLGGQVMTLYAYAEVAGGEGIVLYSAGFASLYIFLTAPYVPTQHYTLFYNFGDFNPPCFVAGTRIATARGEIPVEALRVGDRLIGLLSRRFIEIVWLGHRRLDCAAHPRGHDVWPVRIAAGAFATGTPHHDLLISPDHALFLDDVLVPARFLINGATITQEPVATVSYWHIELPTHDVLLANGLPAESYLDTGNRGQFDNSVGPLAARPVVDRRPWETRACAPFQLDPAAHVPLRRRLLARAPVLGRLLTEDPDLCLLADGVPLPATRGEFAWSVELPPGTREVRLRSRVAVPAHVLPDSHDRRSLGVAVTSLTLDGQPIPPKDERRAAGWMSPEPIIQWTNGDAVVLCDPATSGGRRLDITLAPLLRYWLPSAASRREPVAA
jgi:hypothetical protein